MSSKWHTMRCVKREGKCSYQDPVLLVFGQYYSYYPINDPLWNTSSQIFNQNDKLDLF